MQIQFKPKRCSECNQSLTYLIPIDKGTAQIVKKLALFIKQKGINIVHPRKEMEGNGMSSNEVGNLSRPRMHGLIAKIKGNPGNYCLTRKGAEFLKGDQIPKFAVRDREAKMTIGYLSEEGTTSGKLITTNINDVDGEYWEGINFTIEEGRVVYDL